MSKIIACIDGSIYSPSIADHAGWAASRLGASVELLQVLGRRESASEDRSGRIIAGARKQLLQQLAEVDAERSKLLQEAARLELEEAQQRLNEAGLADVGITLRQGDLLETLVEREAEAQMLVVGKRGEAADFATLHLGSNLERMLRSATIPVLVAARQFKPLERVMVAFDGRASADKAVSEMLHSPLFKGLEIFLISAGDKSSRRQAAVDAAVAKLSAAGLTVSAMIEDGAAIEVIPKAVTDKNIDMLVMGAYGHSRLRTLVIGSTTSEMIRQCLVPILVYR